MTVQEINKLDILTKEGLIMSVEHRDLKVVPNELWLLQVLLKNQLNIDMVKQFVREKKFDSDKVALVVVADDFSSQNAKQLSKYRILLKKAGDKSVQPTFLSLEKANIQMGNDELALLVRNNAELWVKILGKENIKLDYSIDSLKKVDGWIVKNRKNYSGNMSQFDVVVMAGCYLGECIRKRMSAHWELKSLIGFSSFSLILVNSGTSNPLGRVYKAINQNDDLISFAAGLLAQ